MKKIATILLLCASLTLSAQVKDSLELSLQGAVSMESLVEGRVAGLDISSLTGSRVGAVSAAIRGINSLTASSQPLWIIDGAVINPVDSQTDAPFWQSPQKIWAAPQNTLLGFSVYDVESIEVIKDLGAAARYGASGANGVIIVNTKKGSDAAVRLYADLDAPSLSPVFNVSAGGDKNGNRYYLSGHYRGLKGESSYGNGGGFRFNFDSRRNGALSLGMSSSASISSFGDETPFAEQGGDIEDDSNEYRTTDAFWMELLVARNLRLRADVGVDYRAKRRYIWYGSGTAFGEENNGAASVSSLEQFGANASFTAEWSRWFGKEHLSVCAFGDALMNDVSSSVMTGFDFFDYGLKAKGINIAGSAAKLHRSDYTYSRYGAGGRVQYDHNGVVGADAGIRFDGDNSFGETQVYPSVNAFVDIKKLAGGSSELLSSARLTAGWGRAGLSSYVPYLHFGDYSAIYPTTPDNDFQAFFRGRSLLKSAEINAGLELGLFADRLKAAVKYYDKETEDSFTVFCNGREFGQNGYWKYDSRFKDFEQWGSIRNRGVEASVDALALSREELSLNICITAAYNANIVKGVPYTGISTDALLGRWAYSDVAGYAPGVIVGFESKGGTLTDFSGDGEISDADRVVLGNVHPKVVTGLSASLGWRRYSLDAVVTGRFGAKYLDIFSLFKADAALGHLAPVSSQYVKSADMVRLAHLSLAYDVPLGKASSYMGLKVRLTAIGPSAPAGTLPFEEKGSYVAGICLTL